MKPPNTPINSGTSGTRQSSVKRQKNVRPIPRTPRFIFSSSNPSGSASAPRFVATPRFVLNGETKHNQVSVDDIDEHEDDLETSSVDGAAPEKTQRPKARRDVIPDSEDDDSLSQEDTPGTPLRANVREDSMEICDAEGDDLLFPPSPTQREIKRRRLSGSSSRAGRGYCEIEIDPIARSSEPESSPSLENHQTTQEDVPDTIASPTTYGIMSTPLPTAIHNIFDPESSRNAHTVFDYNPSTSLGMAPEGSSETLGPTITASTPLRRPRFILPITPSRQENENNTGLQPVETLFSPTLTRNARVNRGRRPADLEYIAGGMASEVRNWILEMNARKQTSQLSATQGPRGAFQTPVKYYITAKIDKVVTTLEQQSSRGITPDAPGQVAPKTLINPSKQLPEQAPKCGKVLLFGRPFIVSGVQSAQTDGGALVRPGDWVGIRRGMVWEMEINPVTGSTLARAGIQQGETEVSSEKWLVGLEWDIILPPTTGQDQS